MRPLFALLILLAVPALAQPELTPTVDAASGMKAPAGPQLHYRLTLGAQLGFVHPVGAQATATLFSAGKPRFDVDLLWEPSAGLQSYSVGGAYHLLDSVFFVGPRLRLLQWHLPGTRGFNAAADSHLGVGLEAGLRTPIAFDGRLILGASLGATAVPTASSPVQVLTNFNVSLAWALFSRAR